MDNITQALERTKEYLLNTQNEDGSWAATPDNEPKGPDYLQKPLVITAQVIDILIHLNVEDKNKISKGIFFCYKEKIEDTDHIELLSYQLKVLSYANADYIKKKEKQLLKTILNRQHKDGFWPSFPKTSNLTNFIVTDTIVNYNCNENLKKIKEWLLKNKSKDNLGWGWNEDSEKAQVSFTSNALITLSNYNQEMKELNSIIEFLEAKQNSDGGWPSSDFTYKNESTTYSTALVLWILLKKDLNNKKIEAGIKYLIKLQLPDGSWPLKENGKSEYFTTCYVSKVLKYYLFLKEKIKNENVIILLDNSKSKYNVINYLFKEFDENIRKEFLRLEINHIADKILATTSSAVKRRKTILLILDTDGEKDIAEIIDELKKIEGYKGLHKKSHIAQIKNDMDALTNLGLIDEYKRRYFLVKKL